MFRRAAELEEMIAQEEEERYAIEKASEEAHKRQDIEEKLAEIALSVPDDTGALDSTSDECHCHDNVKSQDHEERPDSPDADDDTHVRHLPQNLLSEVKSTEWGVNFFINLS